MKVFVIGATGYIGLPVARALNRAGHIVYGLTRSEKKAQELAADEIYPVIGNPETPDEWVDIVIGMDVVIEALGGTADLSSLGPSVLNAVTTIAKSTRPPGTPKLTFIYTSGLGVHGHSRTNVVTDTTPLPTDSAPLVRWRIAHEQAVLTHPVLNGIVIRPGFVYGGSGSILAPLYKSASEGKVTWPGTHGGRYPTIHFDDLADMYVRAAEKASLVGGVAFDAANNASESVDDFLARLVDVSGAQGPFEYRKAVNVFEEAVLGTIIVRPYLARTLLGWEPRMPSLIDGLQRWYAAWKASGGSDSEEHYSQK